MCVSVSELNGGVRRGVLRGMRCGVRGVLGGGVRGVLRGMRGVWRAACEACGVRRATTCGVWQR